ncbi:hypothetical protein H2203_009117 [Taxawa tesnikishii (nom. ined.)]|nr:hypothetical protein H2203_009117 [Dothideales sp. JES 119]
MPLAFQVANLQVKPPVVGENGYQEFNPRRVVLPKGWNGNNSRALSEDLIVEHDVEIRVRDGCSLYCDIFRPVGSDEESVPAIVAWSPFGKKHSGISMMSKVSTWTSSSLPLLIWEQVKWGCGVPDGCLSGLERFEGPDPAEYCPRGFAIVNVDSRGAGNSDGSIVIMGTQEGEDGFDVIEALAKMPWCNGSVGLAGNSHLGIVQWFIAALRPPSLKAIAPWEACGDLYREQFVRGGAWDNGLFDFITAHVIRGRNGLEDFKEMYRRSQIMNPYWKDKRANIKNINIPTYVVASYSSFVHTMGSIRGWLEVDTKDKWLRWDPYQEWFDLWSVKEYLKGKQNGWEQTPRVRMASLRFGDKDPIYPIVEENFPIPRTQYQKLFFGEDNDLVVTAPSKTSFRAYNSESGTNPVAHVAFNLKFDKTTRLMGLPKVVLHASCDDFDDMVLYALVRKLDSNGTPMVNVNIPWSSVPYQKMDDIPPSDYSNLMIYFGPLGVLRASHRKIDPSRSIHSQYPFHTHDEVQKVRPGTIVELEIGLWAMGIDFEDGESLSVQISGEYPLVDEFKGAKSHSLRTGIENIKRD